MRSAIRAWSAVVAGTAVVALLPLGAFAQGTVDARRIERRGDSRLDVEYGFDLQRRGEGEPLLLGSLAGVRSGDAFVLRLRARQETWAYLFVGGSDGTFRLVLAAPAKGKTPGRLPRVNEWVSVPHDGRLRFDRETGVERLYLFLSPEPLTEIGDRLETSEADAEDLSVEEAWLVGLKEAYAHAGQTTHDEGAKSTRLTMRRRGALAVAVETWTVRHRRETR